MTSFEIGFGNNLTNMEAPELLIAFRGTNFSRRTQPNPSQTHLEPYFAKSHPSVSPFSAKKNMVRTRIGSILGILQLGVGSLSLALGGVCSTFLSEERRSQPTFGPLLGHFWPLLGFWTIAGFCPIFALLLALLLALMGRRLHFTSS